MVLFNNNESVIKITSASDDEEIDILNVDSDDDNEFIILNLESSDSEKDTIGSSSDEEILDVVNIDPEEKEEKLMQFSNQQNESSVHKNSNLKDFPVFEKKLNASQKNRRSCIQTKTSNRNNKKQMDNLKKKEMHNTCRKQVSLLNFFSKLDSNLSKNF